MRAIKRLLVVAGITMSLATQAAPIPSPPAAATPAELRSMLAAQMAEHDVPGASYALFDRHGTILTGVVGLASTRTAKPVTPGTLFRMGSITKTVTAIAIMQLVEQGRFTLQTPVAQLLPSAPLNNDWDKSDPIRVVHLLTHTAGLDDTHPKAFFAASEQPGHHLGTVLANPESLTARWRPGTRQSYSNPAYVLLGAILESQYRQNWDTIVRERVLTPLGMHDTVALNSEALRRDHADGHTGPAMRPTLLHAEPAQAHGALWSTAADLAKLGRYIMSDGESAPGVLGAGTLRLMKQPQGFDSARAGLEHGNGLGIRHRAVANERWQGHSGGVLGALASMHFHARQGMGYAVMINSDRALRQLELPLAAYIARQSRWQRPELGTEPVSPDTSGWYRSVNPRISLLALPTYLLSSGRAQAHGDTLRITPPLPGFGMDATLKHHGKGLLADIDDGDVVTGAIVRSADGKVSALDLDGTTMERSSMLAVVLPLASVLLALPLLATVPFGRRGALRNPWVRGLPALALLVLLAGIVCAASLRPELLAAVNWQTAGVAAATTVFPLLAVLALIVNLRSWRSEPARIAKWRCLLGSIAALVLAAWLAAFDLFALALWWF